MNIYRCYIFKTTEFVIPTKKLFNLYDIYEGIILHTPEGDVYIPSFTWDFKTTTDYSEAIFDIQPSKILTDYQSKLTSIFHEDWLNRLWGYLNTNYFIAIVKDVAELRKVEMVSPAKDLVFQDYLQPISKTVIKDSLTWSDVGTHDKLWEDFIYLTKQIQHEYCKMEGKVFQNPFRKR